MLQQGNRNKIPEEYEREVLQMSNVKPQKEQMGGYGLGQHQQQQQPSPQSNNDMQYGINKQPEQSVSGQPIALRASGVHMPRSIYAQQNSHPPMSNPRQNQQPPVSPNLNHTVNNTDRSRNPSGQNAGFFSTESSFPRLGVQRDLYHETAQEDQPNFAFRNEIPANHQAEDLGLDREEPEWVRSNSVVNSRMYMNQGGDYDYTPEESQQLVSALPPPQHDDHMGLNPNPGSRFSPIGTGAHLDSNSKDDMQPLAASMSYASALRATPKPKLSKTGYPLEDRGKTASPLMLIKDLGNRQNKDGYYSYFN